MRYSARSLLALPLPASTSTGPPARASWSARPRLAPLPPLLLPRRGPLAQAPAAPRLRCVFPIGERRLSPGRASEHAHCFSLYPSPSPPPVSAGGRREGVHPAAPARARRHERSPQRAQTDPAGQRGASCSLPLLSRSSCTLACSPSRSLRLLVVSLTACYHSISPSLPSLPLSHPADGCPRPDQGQEVSAIPGRIGVI